MEHTSSNDESNARGNGSTNIQPWIFVAGTIKIPLWQLAPRGGERSPRLMRSRHGSLRLLQLAHEALTNTDRKAIFRCKSAVCQSDPGKSPNAGGYEMGEQKSFRCDCESPRRQTQGLQIVNILKFPDYRGFQRNTTKNSENIRSSCWHT